MKIKGIHHISLKVPAELYEKTVGFYRDLLGLPVLREQESAVFLSTGNAVLEILPVEQGENGKGALDHFAFETEDVDGLLAELEQAGYAVTMYPTEHTFAGETPYRVYIAFVTGPAGESVELFREL